MAAEFKDKFSHEENKGEIASTRNPIDPFDDKARCEVNTV